MSRHLAPDYQQRYSKEEVKVKKIDTVLIKRLLSYLYPYRFWVTFAILTIIISKAIEAWIPIKIGQVTQTFLDHENSPPLVKEEVFHFVGFTCLMLLGWILLTYLLDILNLLIKNWIGQKALYRLRTEVYQHIQELPIAFYDQNAVGRLMTRTIHDVDQINQLFTESIIPLIGGLILFVGIVIGIFVINWKVGLTTLIILPIILLFTERFRYYQRRSYDTVRSIVSGMNTFVQEHLMGVGVVRNFNLHKTEKKEFDVLNEDHFVANVETIHHFAIFFSGIEFLQNMAMISVFVILVIFASGQEFQAGTFLTFNLYGLMIFRPLADLVERYNVLQAAMASAERIFEILDTPKEPTGPKPGLPLTHLKTIVFDNVWFAYEGENWILKGLSLTIRQGESVALIGVTGAGKTSVMNLLLRMYEFQKGKIWINGQDIRDYAVSTLRHQFSVILQDPVIFSGTISENIALYDPTITPQQIQASADYVSLTPTIERLQNHFEQVLTERGSSLSVGEMQLIALARAVAHQRSMLIFDEATSNIDVQTEKVIQEALKKILTHKTALVIAHRLSTIKDVHRIFVLHQGVVAESGTHQELLDKQGLYEKLYRLQFMS